MLLRNLFAELFTPFLLIGLGYSAGIVILSFDFTSFEYWYIVGGFIFFLIIYLYEIRDSGPQISWRTKYNKKKQDFVDSIWPKTVLICFVIISIIAFFIGLFIETQIFTDKPKEFTVTIKQGCKTDDTTCSNIIYTGTSSKNSSSITKKETNVHYSCSGIEECSTLRKAFADDKLTYDSLQSGLLNDIVKGDEVSLQLINEQKK